MLEIYYVNSHALPRYWVHRYCTNRLVVVTKNSNIKDMIVNHTIVSKASSNDVENLNIISRTLLNLSIILHRSQDKADYL